ncbi:alpha/beta hydrolase [Mycolicibacterium psychrotolerans]|uniref:alpha/beta hydrolase n=1 Tax=Mycolicibacterium psychrotolerans TaxID=216929 RepID=UPI001FE5930C|nr:alpha/beta fold hydrolase [Mycolicibacterium psychrotolerans]
MIEKGSTTAAHPTPLLFVHGACSAAWIWDDHFLDFFAEKGHHAVALSLRGHGASSLSQPLGSCSLVDYAEDVSIVAAQLRSPPVLIGHSMGCWVVLKYLESRSAPAAVLLAPGTPQGLRRWALRAALRHPWLMVRSTTFGNTVDLFDSPQLAREFLFSSGTPESVVRSCVNRLTPESTRATRGTVKPLPDPRRVTAPMLVLSARADTSRVDGDASSVAAAYRADSDAFPDMGHAMMLEPGWSAVAERIETWLTGKGL